MNAIKKISVEDIWTPPVVKNAPFLPSGNSVIDQFATIVRTYKYETSSNYAIAIGINSRSLNTIINTYTGLNTLQFRNQLLIYDAEWYLIHTVLSIKEIAAKMGYKNANVFSNFFTRMIGLSPSRYRSAKRSLEVKKTYSITVK